MIQIHTQSIGRPRVLTDDRGEWRSAIRRTATDERVALGLGGLDGDQVGNTKYHGTPDQAVCCHPLVHFDYWNAYYGLADTDRALQPGCIGENWTLSGVDESQICIGDEYSVGGARVQVTMPRIPCATQQRAVGILDFIERTLQTLRTGWYLRVLIPGAAQTGDELVLVSRPNPEITVHSANVGLHRAFDWDLVQKLLAAPELAEAWKLSLRKRES